MDAELKAKWVAALRSGEYKQTAGLLYSTSENAYCSLGVLCVVSGRSPLYTSLPLNHEKQQDLIKLNDKEHRSFPEIADYIEANL